MTAILTAIGFLIFGLGLSIPFIVISFFKKDNEESRQLRFCVKCGRSIQWDTKICSYCKYVYN
ncbi:MAG: hypothetical protein JXA99_08735 [Candidatus Lokiarchaeota archaeon]|nr:hypothetical protein [Candidatus Lokiarchaeota archaeon]